MSTLNFNANGFDAMQSALTTPFRGGCEKERLPLNEGEVSIVRQTREPYLYVSLLKPLVDQGLAVKAEVNGEQLPMVVFGAYSHSGTHLPLYNPEVTDGIAGPVDIALTLYLLEGDEAFSPSPALGVAMPEEDAADYVEILVVEGLFGRMMMLMQLEKQRLIRLRRQVATGRVLDLARGRSLDDYGAGLGVPRIHSNDETDSDYRARLRIYQQFRMPSPAVVEKLLNGPGSIGEANAGLPSLVGITDRFSVIEKDNPLALSFKLIDVGSNGAQIRQRFHDLLQAHYLLNLDQPVSDGLPVEQRTLCEMRRTYLLGELTRNPVQIEKRRYLSPLLAITLERAMRFIRAAGITRQIRLYRAYDPQGGSRYELGLGALMTRLSSTNLTQIANALPTIRVGEDKQMAALAESMQPQPAGVDPLGRWFWDVVGFRTVFEISSTQIYCSALPNFGLEITGSDHLDEDASSEYQAKYQDSGAGDIHVLVSEAEQRFIAMATENGYGSISAMDANTLDQVLNDMADGTIVPAEPPYETLITMGLAVGAYGDVYAQSLINTYGLDTIKAYAFSKAQLDALEASTEGLKSAMSARVNTLFDAGFYSARAIWDDHSNRLLLLVSIGQLPGASSIPGEAPPASFLWYEASLPDSADSSPLLFSKRLGSRAMIGGKVEGLGLVMCIAYARRGLTDPYEYRIELEQDDPEPILSLKQYGYVMNLLETWYPIGIGINTFDLRKHHVDADGDGASEWLISRASRTYQRYRHRPPISSSSRLTSQS